MKTKIRQRGETIVEVLLAIAVLGSALAGAFSIVNRSKLTIQANKERYQAQLLANSQADSLKVYSSDVTHLGILNATAGNFCIMNDTLHTLPNNICKPAIGVDYNISITPISGLNSNRFLIKIQWDSLTNSSGDQVEIGYAI